MRAFGFDHCLLHRICCNGGHKPHPTTQENGNLSYRSGSLEVITNQHGAVVTIRCSLINMNLKENQITLLRGLKEDVEKKACSIEEAQGRLSQIILRECDSKQTEIKAKRLDNEMELIIHTFLMENQGKAAMSVIDEAISYIHGLLLDGSTGS